MSACVPEGAPHACVPVQHGVPLGHDIPYHFRVHDSPLILFTRRRARAGRGNPATPMRRDFHCVGTTTPPRGGCTAARNPPAQRRVPWCARSKLVYSG